MCREGRGHTSLLAKVFGEEDGSDDCVKRGRGHTATCSTLLNSLSGGLCGGR